ncbi:MAG: Rid family hydrolase [Rubricoccaceae bacterium]|nr:Rid family hydrolase [Rubricoccaceae bacterium]
MVAPCVRLLLLALVAVPGALAQDAERSHVAFLNGAGILPTEPALPFSDAVRVGDVVFLSGITPIMPGTLELVPGGTAAEARQTLDNIETMLTAHGLGRGDVVKCTGMMEDIAEWGAFNAIYAEFFEAPYPARSAFGADGLALGARLEVECIAAVPEQIDLAE